jgi:plastocyanin
MEHKWNYTLVSKLTTITAVLFVITVHFSMHNQSSATVLLNDSAVIEKQFQLQLRQLMQPNINASYVFDAHNMVLGNNVKNLVILIPNEAHESTNQSRDQYPLANQPYLPQNIILNAGTAVTWFNGDVDHERTITAVRGNSIPSSETPTSTAAPMYESGGFEYNTAVTSLAFNNTGTYTFFEKDVNEDDPAFIMNGTITVINQPELSSSSSSASGTFDTVGVLMVPSPDLQLYTSDLTSRGFGIDSTHNFKDLRGGQSGTGDEQTLIVWTTSGMDLSDTVANLQELSSELPYS